MKDATGQDPPQVRHEFSRAVAVRHRPRRSGSERITLRLTEEERARLRNRCEGMTVSAYVRQCLFGGKPARSHRRSYQPVGDQKAMAEALALLGQSRLANNLNQLAYHANIGTLLVDDETVGQIKEAYRHVLAIRAALLKALGLSGAGMA